MKAIKLKETDLIAVVVPMKSNKAYISGTNYVVYYDEKGYRNVALNEPLDGKYEVLGCVTKDHIDFDVESYQHWRDTNNTPEQSFRSLLTANGILFEPPQYCGCSGPCGIPCSYADWDDAGRPLTPKVLILKKLK